MNAYDRPQFRQLKQFHLARPACASRQHPAAEDYSRVLQSFPARRCPTLPHLAGSRIDHANVTRFANQKQHPLPLSSVTDDTRLRYDLAMERGDTGGNSRAVLLTPPGPGAIAVVRLSGEGVVAFLQRHFSREAKPARPVHGLLRDGQRVIDDPVVVLAPDEAFADINLHGGPWVVRSVMELARREGFEVIDAPPLPLPVPVVAVDAVDALQREVLTHLPLARTELGVRALLAQPHAWRVVHESCSGGCRPQHVCWKPTLLRVPLSFLLRDHSLHWLLHPPHVAIIGAPNVGKSTLANQLFGQERSITADMPGTTRDWVGEIANLDGLAVMLIDTPGYRDAPDEIERTAIARSRRPLKRADLIVIVLDAARRLADDERKLMRENPEALIVLNKVDLAGDAGEAPAGTIRTVARDGAGVDELRRAVRGRFGCEPFDPAQPRCWTDRQRAIVRRALDDPRALAELF